MRVCRNSLCGKLLQPWERGLCRACESRWRRRGKPAEGPGAPRPLAGPPPPKIRETEKHTQRMRAYRRMRSAGRTPAEMAREMGVTTRTISRYAREARYMDVAGPSGFFVPVVPPADELTRTEQSRAAYHIAAFARDARDAFDLAGALGLGRDAFEAAAKSLPRAT